MVNSPTNDDRLLVRLRPDQSILMHQNWRHLFFIHWKFDAEMIQKTLPKNLYVDTYNGNAYIGIVPFFIKDFRAFHLPSMPFLSNFLEINVRTYVYDKNGIPGIWFYSLDIDSVLSTFFARIYFYLPYFWSKIEAEQNTDGSFHFKLKRKHDTSNFLFRPTKKSESSDLNSLNFFLIERYILFTVLKDQIYRGQVHHQPYPLQEAELILESLDLFNWDQLERPLTRPEHVLYSPGVDVEIFNIQKVL